MDFSRIRPLHRVDSIPSPEANRLGAWHLARAFLKEVARVERCSGWAFEQVGLDTQRTQIRSGVAELRDAVLVVARFPPRRQQEFVGAFGPHVPLPFACSHISSEVAPADYLWAG